MIRKHYWASALMVITAVGLAGTTMVPSTRSFKSIEPLNQRYERASVQHRDKGGLIQMSLAATDWTATDKEITPVDLEILYADSHRGSGRLTAQATNSTVVLAWRGTGRISPLDATALA